MGLGAAGRGEAVLQQSDLAEQGVQGGTVAVAGPAIPRGSLLEPPASCGHVL